MSFSPALYDAQLEATNGADEMALAELQRQVLEFDERLRRVEEGIIGLRGNQEQMLSMFQRMVLRHDEQLNGVYDKPGLVVKLDRLERIEQSRVRNLLAIWAAILAGMVKVFIDWLRVK